MTVACPVFNGAPQLASALNDVAREVKLIGKPYEILISDNASTDGTKQICEEFVKSQPEGSVRYVRQSSNIGLYPNYQFLLDNAQSKYIVFASHDDRIRRGFYRTAVIALEHSDAVLAFPHLRVIDPDTQEILRYEAGRGMGFGASPMKRFLRTVRCLESCPIHGMFRVSSLRATRGFRNQVGADHLLLNELSLQGSFTNLNKIFIDYFEESTKFSDSLQNKKISGKTFEAKSKWLVANLITAVSNPVLSPREKFYAMLRTAWIQKRLPAQDVLGFLNLLKPRSLRKL